MENLNVQLEDPGFVKSAEVIVRSLDQLKMAFSSFAGTPSQKLTAELQGLRTTMVDSTQTVKSELTKMIKGAQSLSAEARKAGQSVGKGLADGLDSGTAGAITTMRAKTQLLQVEFEKLAAIGSKVNNLTFKPAYLDRIRAQSINIGPDLKGQSYDNRADLRDVSKYDVLLKAKKRLQTEEVNAANLHASQLDASNTKLLANLAKKEITQEREVSKYDVLLKTKKRLLAEEVTANNLQASQLDASNTKLLSNLAKKELSQEREVSKYDVLLKTKKRLLAEEVTANNLQASQLDASNTKLLANLAKKEVTQEREVSKYDVLLKTKKRLLTEEVTASNLQASQLESANTRLLSNLAKKEITQEREVSKYDVILKAKKRLQAEEVTAANLHASQLEASNAKLLSNLERNSVARNALINKDARFNAAGPAAQLNRAVVVANALSGGMSEADATKLYGAAALAASRDTRTLAAATKNLAGESKLLYERSREVHSAFRGIAASAGGLFLTYGSLIPLAAAFFTTTAIRASISAYKDLEYQIKFVQALEEGGLGTSVDSARKRIGIVATDAGYDPVEAAKGQRLLAQAGLNVKESFAALPAVLKTATVGELSVAEATTTLTGAVHAFGLNMGEIGFAGDVMAKAGAISNTSVQSMSESMKQASTVAQQYGLHLEDVSTVLVTLAKRNITGTAAGTATANMMRELVNPKGRAKKAADSLDFTVFNQNGEVKDLFSQIVPELRKKLAAFTPEAQKLLVSDLSNNRGEKALQALLGTTDADLAEIQGKLREARGFVNSANATLMDSLEGDTKRLKSAFNDAMADAGSAGSVALRDALVSLRELVGSPEFHTALAGLVNGFALLARGAIALASALTTPLGAIVSAGTAFLVLTRGAAGAASLLAGLASAVGLTSAPMAALAGTAGAATVAATGLGGAALTLLRVFSGFTVVGLGITALGLLLGALKDRSGTDVAIKASEDYGKRLKYTNNELEKQINLKKELEGAPGKSTGMQNAREAIASAQKEYDKALNRSVPIDSQIQIAREKLSKAQSAGALILNQEGRNRALINPDVDGRVSGFYDARAKKYGLSAKGLGTIAEQLPKAPSGDKTYTPYEKGSGIRGATQEYSAAKSDLDNILKDFRQRASVADRAAEQDELRLTSKFSRGLILQNDYENALDKIQTEHLAVRQKLAEDESAKVGDGLEKLKAEAKRANLLKDRAVVMPALNAEIEKRTLALESSQNALNKAKDDVEKDKLKLGDKKVKDLVSEMQRADDYVLKSAQELVLLKQQSAERQTMLGLTEREQVVQAARMSSAREFTSQLFKLNNEIARAEKNGGDPGTLAKAKEDLSRLNAGGALAMKVSGDIAGSDFDAEKLQKATEAIRSGFADAVMSGGTEGFDSLSQLIENELLRKPFKIMLEAAFNPLSSALASASTSIGKSLLGSISSIFSGPSAAVATTGYGLDSIFGTRAGGGPVSAGNKYLVGENGPEVVEFPNAGKVYNTNESSRMASPPAAQTSVNVTVSPVINIDSRSDQAQVAQMVSRGMQEAQKQMAEQLKKLGVLH